MVLGWVGLLYGGRDAIGRWQGQELEVLDAGEVEKLLRRGICGKGDGEEGEGNGDRVDGAFDGWEGCDGGLEADAGCEIANQFVTSYVNCREDDEHT